MQAARLREEGVGVACDLLKDRPPREVRSRLEKLDVAHGEPVLDVLEVCRRHTSDRRDVACKVLHAAAAMSALNAAERAGAAAAAFLGTLNRGARRHCATTPLRRGAQYVRGEPGSYWEHGDT